MLQRLGIRGKILAVVAVPILVLVLAAAFITASAAQTFTSAQNSEDLIATLGQARELETDLQEERLLSEQFSHTIQDGEDKLDEAYEFTDTALSNLEAAAGTSEEPDATDESTDESDDASATDESEEDTTPAVDGEALMADVDAAINRTSGGYMEAARAVQIAAPAEEGGWVQFPSAEDIESMQAAYADAVAAVDEISAGLPDGSGLDIPLAALSFRLNYESESAAALFTEPLAYEEPLEAVWERVDAGVQGLLGSSERLAGNEANERAVEALLSGQDAVASLPNTRAAVRAATVNVSAVINGYTSLIGTIVSAADDVSVAMSDRDLVTSVQAYGDLDGLIENMRYEEVVIDRLIREGAFLPGEAATARTMTARTDISLEEAQDSSAAVEGAEPVPAFGASASVLDGTASSFQTVRTQVLTGLDASLVAERDSGWSDEVDTEVAAYEPLRDEMWTTVTSTASNDTQAALAQAILTGLAAIAIVIVSIIIALVIARRIIGPLRRLTTTATAVRQELPRLVERVALPGEDVDVTEVQIPVESQDEVGRLAEAFNGVNAATLSIAAEQAALRGSISEMFVNVARRDQVLLNRQLSSIDDMERTEDDPETLTRLFALDHLATRMRRNSESLLVLAGIDTGRRLRRPMPLSDVVRTASSEIELYERVDLHLDDDPSMLGHTALTAAHLFAELLENATVFSDPGTRVSVRTAAVDGGFAVEVEDHGIGMTESEVAEANARVGSTAASEILGEQRLGLFVVGRIARRIGAQVEVRSEEGRGTVATVMLPTALFAGADGTPTEAASPAPGQVSMAVDEAVEAPAPVLAASPEREIAAGPAYTPAAVQEGASLSGRDGDLPARGGELPSRGGDLPARGGAVPAAAADPHSIDALIAADAAAAPSAQEADVEGLTEGTNAAGLPTRRRRTPQTPSADGSLAGVVPVVGLPARATEEQLSALDAEASGGFTPTVAPSEVAPQSADERASMFRGFRSRRETEQAAAASDLDAATEQPLAIPALDDDSSEAHESAPSAPTAESEHDRHWGATAAGAGALGAAAFFGARGRSREDEPQAEDATASGDVTPAEQPVIEPEPIPTFALEPDEAAGVSGFRLPKFDPSTTGQIPVISDEVADEHAASSWETPEASEPAAPAVPEAMNAPAIPWLVEDEPVADAADESPAAEHIPTFAFEPDEDEVPATDAAPQWDATPAPELEDIAAAVADEAPAYEQAADEAPAYAAPAYEAEQPADASAWARSAEPVAEPVAEPEPVGPFSFDEAVAAPDATSAPEPAAQPYFPADAEGVTPAWARVASTPAAPEEAEPADSTPFAGVDSVALDEAPASESPQLDDLIQSAVEEDHRPGFFSRLFGRGRKDDEAETPAPSAPSAPTAFAPVVEPVAAPPAETAPSGLSAASAPTAFEPGEASFAPSQATFEPGPAGEPAPASATAEEAPQTPSRGSLFSAMPVASFEPEPQPEPEPEPAPQAFAPQAFEPERYQAPTAFAPQAFEPQHTEQEHSEPQPASAPTAFEPVALPEQQAPEVEQFSAEELAQAHGWEAAGESALQAAAPESATTYQPIIRPEERDGGDTDVASAVFSELSSLAAERPKIEKTRAGLQKRRQSDAPPVEVKPLEEEVAVTPAERDADAVRNRFSAFYSGTQRARQDAADFDRATQIEQDVHGGQD
ncbi:ATP-binding protein [Demequina sp. NBRC 110057]|uniref:ATP-binding protein n=1 Tax=Demequina sp. NBRC 110057 TaxID=1570346 RepID=UPI0009FC54D7|nr:ATP-binding protein [Demequina sp. NBRC 110057]